MERTKLSRLTATMALAVVAVLAVTGTASASAAPEVASVESSGPSPRPVDETPEPTPRESQPDGSTGIGASPAPHDDGVTTPLTPSDPPEPDLILDEIETGEPAPILEEDRSALLGADWSSSQDTAWVISGDAEGLHVLTAKAATGYEWQRIASLTALGFETDKWIGNACLTSDAATLAVVYGPRGFTNEETLFNHGGFAALVNVETGQTRQLGGGYTLAYFNPGCGLQSRVAFTQLDEAQTRIVTVDANAPEKQSAIEVDSQVTSAVPGESGLLAAAAGAVIEIAGDGTTAALAPATGTPYDLAVVAGGDVAYLTHDGENATAYVASSSGTEPVAFAAGDLQHLGIARAGDDSIHVLGSPEVLVDDAAPSLRIHPGTRATSEVSSEGLLSVDSPFRGETGQGDPDDRVAPEESVVVDAKALSSGTDIEFRVHDEPAKSMWSDSLATPEEGSGAARNAPHSQVTAESSTSPVSTGSPCAIPRNNPGIQALQPNLAEVEWAVDQPVRGNLSVQTTFARPPLSGASSTAGTYVPPQILLGILAQESNFWQASRYTVPGVTGNPLMGDYFGTRSASGNEPWWTIDYSAADCGYGIAQVTTGMQTGDMPYAQQLMIATDYRANISR